MASFPSGNMQEKYLKLIEALKQAKQAAQDADPGEDNDGGSCNFDCPAIHLPRVKSSTLATVKEKAGVGLSSIHSWGAGWYRVGVPLKGQAARNTAMAEAAAKALEEALKKASLPWKVTVFYQLD